MTAGMDDTHEKMILKTSTLMTFSFYLISIERKTGPLPTVITLSQHDETSLGLNWNISFSPVY